MASDAMPTPGTEDLHDSTLPSSQPVTVQAPTAALLGRQITSNAQGSSERRSQSSAKSTQSALSERRRRKKVEAAKERPWPDDRKYNPGSLFLFNLQNPIRQTAIRWIEYDWWDTKVISIIILNSITLCMFDPFDTPDNRACPMVPAGEVRYWSETYQYCNDGWKWTTGNACSSPTQTLSPSRMRKRSPERRAHWRAC